MDRSRRACASRIAICRSAAGASQTDVLDRRGRRRRRGRPGARRQLARDGVKRLYAVLDELGARVAPRVHAARDRGRPLAEVAQLVGSSVTATKLRVWRARKRIEAAAAEDPVLREFLEHGG